MDFLDADKLVIFIAFVVPGFVAMKVYNTINPSVYVKSGDKIIEAVCYSSFNYAIWIAPLIYINALEVKDVNFFYYSFLGLVILFISPVILAVLWSSLRHSEIIQKILPHPKLKPWDYLFSKKKPYWVIVTLKDGRRVGGLYGYNSFVSNYPAPEEIFLEQEWILNDERDGFERKVESTCGIIFLNSEILSIELFEVEAIEEDNNES